MNRRALIIFIVVLLVAVNGYFAVHLMIAHHLHNQQALPIDTIRIAPVEPQGAANPEGTSPFDKPNIDPVASDFKNVPDLDTTPITTFQFENPVVDFGTIKEGDVVKAKFKFTNTGKIVLLIIHAQPSCGCTIPTTPREPVKPGESSAIDVEFHSAGKKGQVIKTVTLTANTKPRETVLTIKANIIPTPK